VAGRGSGAGEGTGETRDPSAGSSCAAPCSSEGNCHLGALREAAHVADRDADRTAAARRLTAGEAAWAVTCTWPQLTAMRLVDQWLATTGAATGFFAAEALNAAITRFAFGVAAVRSPAAKLEHFSLQVRTALPVQVGATVTANVAGARHVRGDSRRPFADLIGRAGGVADRRRAGAGNRVEGLGHSTVSGDTLTVAAELGRTTLIPAAAAVGGVAFYQEGAVAIAALLTARADRAFAPIRQDGGAGHVGADELLALDVRSPQIGALQVRSAQAGAAEVRPAQPCPLQIGTLQARLGKVCAVQPCPGEVASIQIAASEIDARTNFLG
jgi:hypothetical protein